MKEGNDKQFYYLGRWVEREHFRAFVYQKDKKCLVKSVAEFEMAIESGLWFDSPENVIEEKSEPKRKLKRADSTDSQELCN